MNGRAQGRVGAVISVVVIGIIAMVGVMIVGQVAGAGLSMGLGSVSEQIEFPETNDSYEISDSEQQFTTVSATRERAIAFDGGDAQSSYVESPTAGGWESGDWAILVTATPEASNGTHTILAYDNESVVVEYHNDSYRATILGDTQNGTVSIADPGGQTPLGVSHDDSEDELTIRTPDGNETANLTTTEPDRDVSLAFDGTIDEARVLNETLTAGEYQTYADDPIDPLNGSEHSLRLMFDEGGGSDTRAFYAGSDATARLSGHTWTDGVADPALDEGTDFTISDSPFTLGIPDGSYFEGAPIVYVNSDSLISASISSIATGFSNSFAFIPIVMLVLLASIAVGAIARLRT